jgi:glycosyltransferase involved in cell wall biosynthesis
MAGPDERPRVLVAGVYLADRQNYAADIARELGRSRRWSVEQRWVALGKAAIPDELAPVTAWRQPSRQGKFVLLNRLLAEADLDRYDFVLFTDDDIVLPDGFVDRYLELVIRHDLALAQPARTHDSYTDHWLVEQLDGLVARRTRFVEIGPLFSMRRDAVRLLTPFDEGSPMGWGYDFVWPVVVEEAGLRMGIVDATPVAHNLRKPVAFYDNRDAALAMRGFLAGRRHLSRHEAFFIVEAYS